MLIHFPMILIGFLMAYTGCNLFQPFVRPRMFRLRLKARGPLPA